jgi:hypothetical protein
VTDRDIPNPDRSPEDRERQKPPRPVRAPLPSRHSIDHIGGNSPPKRRNTIVEPSIDMAWETDLIRQGYADSLGNSRYRVNGRVYVHESHPRNRLYPESGEGVHSLTRNEFAALTLLIRFHGYTVEARHEIEQTPQFTEEVMRVARTWFDKRTRD